jgi:hypothetical protein
VIVVADASPLFDLILVDAVRSHAMDERRVARLKLTSFLCASTSDDRHAESRRVRLVLERAVNSEEAVELALCKPQ